MNKTNSHLQLGILTPKEIKVARALLMYDTKKEVASKLHLSIHTIIFHTASLRRKMGEKRTYRAALKAKQLGLLDNVNL